MSGRRDAEAAELRRARRVIAGQLAVVITALVAVAGAVSYAILVHGQQEDADRTLAWSIHQGVGTRPPGCVWLFTERAQNPPGQPPAGMPDRAAFASVPRPGDVHSSRTTLGGMEYTVRTENVGGQVSQAFFEERYQLEDRRTLLYGLLAAELLALAGAAVTGCLLAGRAIRPLAEALGRQRRFVADASHELRAPLTRLHTRAQLLSSRTLPPRAAEDVGHLVRGTRELGDVVEDLLMSAQLRAARPRFEPVELGRLAEEAVAAEAVRASARCLRIGVTRSAEPYVVHGVPTALRRVLSALLDNAIGYTPPGGTIEVTLAFPDDDNVELSVHDTGTGFAPADAERLFERFARSADDTNGRRFGLGLALVREIVNGHGGTIAAATTPGTGATFTLRLTRAPTSELT